MKPEKVGRDAEFLNEIVETLKSVPKEQTWCLTSTGSRLQVGGTEKGQATFPLIGTTKILLEAYRCREFLQARDERLGVQKPERKLACRLFDSLGLAVSLRGIRRFLCFQNKQSWALESGDILSTRVDPPTLLFRNGLRFCPGFQPT